MNENTSDTGWKNPYTTETNVDGVAPMEYQGWSEERLVDAYRRNSVLLREHGVDERTVQTLCAIEECLRARSIDPDPIIQELVRGSSQKDFGEVESK